ncbi:phosphoribosyl-AMP cyclohydrolase [Prosthecomicrobium pneumaticum]|uniref:Phosphoribosyl-AMP cyclohydrolase n=1 Tax=Prosthecomicrobium pneumaticum TaxID=81895 RepID=A0A7W9FPJ3_9HYPH|nr:phosphoribosyl-AMP cyclohydrolase [Prosthecomicrobium pneumaticum]MBB5754411.1 phosphoribosyl-AMP cyclohydrolase [Prosthecomicrobium pneumaticum]
MTTPSTPALSPSPFAAPGSKHDVETGTVLTPRFGADGLVAAVVVDAEGGEVVMMAWMDAAALARTIETGEAHYYSRSRGRPWKKGEESGHVQTVVELRVDCDQDAVLLKVRTAGTGANCHTGRHSCFYRRVALGGPAGSATLAFTGDAPLFDPDAVYKHG